MAGRKDGKRQVLREWRSLNRRSQRVRDQLFQEDAFFDPEDLVQVKYEMLRRVRVEGQSVAQAAGHFGFSRVAYYQILGAFEREGLPGLVSKRPGPRRAHKLSAAVVDFIEQEQARETSLRARELAQRVRKRFGLTVHPRSIERALARRRKRGRSITPRAKRKQGGRSG
jgi:transposase